MRTLLLALLLVAAPASAMTVGVENPYGPTPTSLYFHLLSWGSDVPMNTQRPAPGFGSDERAGLATNSLCFDEASSQPPPLGQPLLDKEYHTLYAYSTPSYVEYQFLEDGRPRIHPERGVSYDILLDQGTVPVLHWYLATSSGIQDAPPEAVVPVSNVVVRATMRENDRISIGDEAYRQGAVIMEGQSAPATLARSFTQGATWAQVEGQDIYAFTVPLSIEAPGIIPRATGYNLQVEVFLDNPACSGEGDYIMPNLVSAHSSNDHRPRLDLSILNPMQIEYLAPQFVKDELVLHASMNSAWGNYDIDEAGWYNANDTSGVVVEILDAMGDVVAIPHEHAFVQRYHEHGHYTDDIDATYVWNLTEAGVDGGLYQARLVALNDQRTATATATAAFEVGKQDVYPALMGDGSGEVAPPAPLEMPGAALALVVVALASLAAVRRR